MVTKYGKATITLDALTHNFAQNLKIFQKFLVLAGGLYNITETAWRHET